MWWPCLIVDIEHETSDEICAQGFGERSELGQDKAVCSKCRGRSEQGTLGVGRTCSEAASNSEAAIGKVLPRGPWEFGTTVGQQFRPTWSALGCPNKFSVLFGAHLNGLKAGGASAFPQQLSMVLVFIGGTESQLQ